MWCDDTLEEVVADECWKVTLGIPESTIHLVFNNLGHIINYDFLKELYTNLDGKKAVGVDKVSKEAYGEKLISPNLP